MKHRLLFILATSLILFMPSCGKTTKEDQVPDEFTKKVLIEEFGGEWCSFCVRGAKEFDELLNQNPDRYIGVSLHYDDPFEVEYPKIVKMLLSEFEIIAFPATIVERTLDSLRSVEVQSEYRLSRGADVGLNVKTKIVNNNLDITIDYSSVKDIDDAFMTVYIVEDFVPESSPGAQSGGGGNYIHRHVLRQVLTNKSGDPIEVVKNQVNSKSYTGVKLGEYKSSDVRIVAFIHNGTSKSFNVLNANIAKVNDESGW